MKLQFLLAACFVCAFQISTCSSFQPTSQFGKTHFIVGFPHKEYKPVRQKPRRQTGRKRVLFSPDDDVRAELLKLINAERGSIKLAIFLLTDKKITQALLAAHKRGVQIEVVTDPSNMNKVYSKVKRLKKWGVPVFVYDPEHAQNARFNLMHNKFAIFGRMDDASACVWTGSFNFTQSAGMRNQENVVILEDVDTIERFSKHFDVLKKRCAS